ncbi:RGS domain-containing protein [Paraphysoderma sedebokerense]|nr:RGS domain-containing protein [Paraphysoderma sedebokerense]
MKEKSLLNHTFETFEKILNDKKLFVEFKKSLAEDFCIENGLFWEDWRALKSISDRTETERAVHAIYNKYIRQNAQYEINISSSTKSKFIKMIDSKSTDFSIVEEVKKEVFQMMYLNSFPRFIKKLKNASQTGSASNSKITENSLV